MNDEPTQLCGFFLKACLLHLSWFGLDWQLKSLFICQTKWYIFSILDWMLKLAHKYLWQHRRSPKDWTEKESILDVLSHLILNLTPKCPLCEYCTAVFIISVNSISKRLCACSLTPSPETLTSQQLTHSPENPTQCIDLWHSATFFQGARGREKSVEVKTKTNFIVRPMNVGLQGHHHTTHWCGTNGDVFYDDGVLTKISQIMHIDGDQHFLEKNNLCTISVCAG